MLQHVAGDAHPMLTFVILLQTELCRSWSESGSCRYGSKCQVGNLTARISCFVLNSAKVPYASTSSSRNDTCCVEPSPLSPAFLSPHLLNSLRMAPRSCGTSRGTQSTRQR